jgi:hypothetical protein
MINPLKAGVTFGALLGGFDFVFWMHHIQPVFVIRPFSLTAAAALIVFTSIAGFVIALLFAVLWNKLHRYQGLE